LQLRTLSWSLHRHLRVTKDPNCVAKFRRIREEAAKATEEIRRVHGVIDDAAFESLLEDE
jgi:hypothetical protein